MNDLGRAKALAYLMHRGQRYGSMPYTYHLSQVAESQDVMRGGEIMMSAAWLHDILEDTPVTLSDLHNFGFDQRVIDTVCILTRDDPDDEPYTTYITRVGFSRRATIIKLADLKCHLAHDPKDRQRKRYEWALEYLLAAQEEHSK